MLQLGHNPKTTSGNWSNLLRIHNMEGDIPIYNTKATIVPCSDTGYVFLFGGFDELDNLDSNVYLLNLATKRWEIDNKHMGLYREGHLAVYIGEGNVLVFGGIPHDEFPEATESDATVNDAGFRKDSLMMVYNIYEKKWTAAPKFALDNAPSSRYRHACCLSPDNTKIYISGGLVNSMPLDDLYCYDLVSGKWLGPARFVSRFDHSIKVYDGKLYTFGGLDKDMNHITECMAYLSLNNQSINKVSFLLNPEFRNTANDIISAESVNEYPYPSSGSEFERIYTNSFEDPTIELEVSVPVDSTKKEYYISYYDLKHCRFTPLINNISINSILQVQSERNSGYLWKHAFITLSRLYLLGSQPESCSNYNELENAGNTEDTEYERNDEIMSTQSEEQDDDLALEQDIEQQNDQEQEQEDYIKLHCMLELNLSDLGLSFTNSEIDESGSLAGDFKRMLQSEENNDFEIITLVDESTMDKYNDTPALYNNIIDHVMAGEPVANDSFKIIKVHKAVLLARWKHFGRLISSGMNEAQSNRMFIPEPYSWVKGLIFYLYTGSIEFNDFTSDSLIDCSGMLILSNLYEISQLRTQVLNFLYVGLNKFTVESDESIHATLKVWANALISNEELLVAKIVEILKNNWPIVIRSKAFLNLPKALIIRLCQSCIELFPENESKRTHSTVGSLPALPLIASDKDSLDSNSQAFFESNIGTPNSGNNIGELPSNSPFIKSPNRNSPQARNPAEQNTAAFPTLRYLCS